MALRKIRLYGDSTLEKPTKVVKALTPRLKELIEDMIETMHDANGVGLAAPQVGVLRKIVVIDVGDGPLVFINPRIIKTDGEQTGEEGCLSLPGKCGIVTRPNYVKAVACDIDMNEFEIEGTELLARAMCHEFDHLEGIMYVDKAEGGVRDVEEDESEDEDEGEAVAGGEAPDEGVV